MDKDTPVYFFGYTFQSPLKKIMQKLLNLFRIAKEKNESYSS